jgi:glycosyltransferase involved in cell wall biosynthesis
MKIDIVFPALPPRLDGIGDHTAQLAKALSVWHEVRVLTAQQDALPIDGVEIVQAFSLARRRDVRRIIDLVRSRCPDWLFVQFNQFSYGKWGLNLHLPGVVRDVAHSLEPTRVAWMAHEDFVPPRTWKMAVMRTWQRHQFRVLGRASDLVLFSIDPWVAQYRAWFPNARVEHLPAGSNIPEVGMERPQARRRLGIDDATLVVGYFGTMHGSRLISHLRGALEAVRDEHGDMLVLYVGPDGQQLRQAVPNVPIRDAGRLDVEEVSRHFAAMDLQITAFMGGVSSRRGSFMAGLQHGVATVSNMGPQTCHCLSKENHSAFLLSDTEDLNGFVNNAVHMATDSLARDRIGTGGRQLFAREFAWPVLASRLNGFLSS